MFDCPRFIVHQTRMKAVADRLSPENIAEFMLESMEAQKQVQKVMANMPEQLIQGNSKEKKKGREYHIEPQIGIDPAVRCHALK